MSKYDELLSELQAERTKQDDMIKSLSAEDKDDEKIEAAAGDDEEEKDDDEDEGEEGEKFAKSLVLDSGEECIDATDMLKSLQAQVSEQDDLLTKALPQLGGIIRAQNELIAKQGEMIKSLGARVDTLGGQGRGRKAVITLTDKVDAGTLAKSLQADAPLTQEDFMLKANNAFDKKIISGVELSTIDACFRGGYQMDPALVSKVTNA